MLTLTAYPVPNRVNAGPTTTSTCLCCGTRLVVKIRLKLARSLSRSCLDTTAQRDAEHCAATARIFFVWKGINKIFILQQLKFNSYFQYRFQRMKSRLAFLQHLKTHLNAAELKNRFWVQSMSYYMQVKYDLPLLSHL